MARLGRAQPFAPRYGTGPVRPGAVYALSAGGGSYAVSGTDATLTYSGAAAKTLAAGSGTYTITGTAAVLTVTRKLTVTGGIYLMTGSGATLRYSGAHGLSVGADLTTAFTTWANANLGAGDRNTVLRTALATQYSTDPGEDLTTLDTRLLKDRS